MYLAPEKKYTDADRLKWVIKHADSISVCLNWPSGTENYWRVFTKNWIITLGYSTDMNEAIDEAISELEARNLRDSIRNALWRAEYTNDPKVRDEEVARVAKELGVQSDEVYLELERMMDTRIDCPTGRREAA